jgi:hypothetical protein
VALLFSVVLVCVVSRQRNSEERATTKNCPALSWRGFAEYFASVGSLHESADKEKRGQAPREASLPKEFLCEVWYFGAVLGGASFTRRGAPRWFLLG